MNRSELISHIVASLDKSLEKARAQWLNAAEGTKTRHCAIDDLLPQEVAQEIYRAFPSDGAGFSPRNSFRERKSTSFSLDDHPLLLADITYALQSPQVLEKIAEITGLKGLEPDPHLYAGGLSMMFKGDFLNPHIDNSHEQTRTRYRRINLLYYVAPDWKLENGGNLELWDKRVTRPVTVVSAFNRLVLMETNTSSYHSVSPVVADRFRCCVSSYYFSQESPTGENYYHVTSFTGRPEQRFRRILGVADNALRNLARRLGAGRATDKGYTGNLADKL